MRLIDRVAIITGATGGIGKAIAEVFAAEGAKVALTARNKIALEGLAGELSKEGREALAVRADISRAEDVEQAVKSVIERWGRIDILVNAAGIREIKYILDLGVDEWDRVINTNLRGTFLCCKAAVPFLIQNGGGRIINISSVAGSVGMPKRTAYCASKAGVDGLTRQLAMDLGAHQITVNAIAPGIVETPLASYLNDPDMVASIRQKAPLQRWLQPREIAKVALFLASDKASGITGAIIPVDCGFTATRYWEPTRPT